MSNGIFRGQTSDKSFQIDLFHNGGLLIYSFICVTISLSDLDLFYINRPSLRKRSIQVIAIELVYSLKPLDDFSHAKCTDLVSTIFTRHYCLL